MEKQSSERTKGLDFAVIGHNVRSLRMSSNLTQSQLAEAASVYRTTICRLENGKPIHLSNLQKICKVLSRTVEFLATSGIYEEPQEVYFMRKSERPWMALIDLRKHVPADNAQLIQDENERLRLGRAGLVPVFHSLIFAMPEGPGMTFAEVYQPIVFRPSDTYKDCLIYCLRGEIRVTVAGQTFDMAEGDVIGYAATEFARHEPIHEIGPNDLPPVSLYVGANRIGRLPAEANRRQRGKPRRRG